MGNAPKFLVKEVTCGTCPGCLGSPCNGEKDKTRSQASRARMKPVFTAENEFTARDGDAEEPPCTWCPRADEIVVEEVVAWTSPTLSPTDLQGTLTDAALGACEEVGADTTAPSPSVCDRPCGCAPPTLSRWASGEAVASPQEPSPSGGENLGVADAAPSPQARNLSRPSMASWSLPSERHFSAEQSQTVNVADGSALPWRAVHRPGSSTAGLTIEGPFEDDFDGFLEAGTLDEPTPTWSSLLDVSTPGSGVCEGFEVDGGPPWVPPTSVRAAPGAPMLQR